MTFVLKSEKAIEFYTKNSHIDFNQVNEMFVDMIQKLTSTVQNSLSVNELKLLLHNINNKMKSMNDSMENQKEMNKMTYDALQSQKEYYVVQMKSILENRDSDNSVLNLIRETNQTMIDKTIYSILEQFPKLNETMHKDLKQILYVQQNEIVKENQRTFKEIMERQDKTNSPQGIESLLQQNYKQIQDKIYDTMTSYYDKVNETNSMFQNVGKDFQNFLEKQKNSTLKGKESEEKLESCLVSAFPHAEIINQSGKPQSCDYLVRRNEKHDILFENKDYSSNVPHDEIKKFIRDIEFQNKHGIMLSQHSGITQKQDYQIDIHSGFIMVFVHFVHYDESKIRLAVNIIDHLAQVLEKTIGGTKGMEISMDELSEINKEYLTFIGQKKSLIEITKKMHKDQLKAMEDFQMPQLTALLNSKFTNVEQLQYKCDICGIFSAKNKRALTTHKNKCKKKFANLNPPIPAAEEPPVEAVNDDVIMTSSTTNIVDLNKSEESESESDPEDKLYPFKS